MGERIAAREQQLERIVEAGRVRLAVRDDRPRACRGRGRAGSDSIVRRRAFIQLTLPRTVLISPLWRSAD